ncbi:MULTISPECIES: hypothetical protein [Acidobacteriaceae]|uniref:hypothetical protein n=1 Tax=Acidobacteriaceae TaxID=204434 RepID=UPI00131D839E|nr:MULTISPECIES: hypothetical protein [Acidobacteriaceae]MDW5267830.1 hypothetical protein [Edaphobacter sp.]
MRLPFPERIPLLYVICFAALLSIAQLLQGTPAAISLCCFLFIIIAAFTFNLAGGFTSASGGYVFFYAVLVVIVGITWKAVLGEQAGSDLKQPLLTFQVYVGGITAMLAAVFFSRKLTAKRPLLANMVSDENMSNAATGCMIAGFALTAVITVAPSGSGSVLSAVGQVNFFLPLAIILGTIAQIRKSGGTSSVNLTVLIACGALFAGGLINFSKQGIFSPPLCWLIAAASQRYRITFYQTLGCVLALLFMGYYLVPYSQYGRNYKSISISENVSTSISLLSKLDYVREQSHQTADGIVEDRVQAYFDTPQGFFDRLQMISPDDALINVTEDNGNIGYVPIVMDFANLIPHFLWPGKPEVGFGNLYAHEIGMIGADDFSTGISFSPTGEAFHLGRWMGIFVLAPLLWIMLFVIFDSLCGDVRKYPWGLLAIVIFAHEAPEGMLRGVVHDSGYFALGIVVAAVTSAYVMPIIGALVSVPERTRLRRIAPIRSIPRRLPPAHPPQESGR